MAKYILPGIVATICIAGIAFGFGWVAGKEYARKQVWQAPAGYTGPVRLHQTWPGKDILIYLPEGVSSEKETFAK